MVASLLRNTHFYLRRGGIGIILTSPLFSADYILKGFCHLEHLEIGIYYLLLVEHQRIGIKAEWGWEEDNRAVAKIKLN